MRDLPLLLIGFAGVVLTPFIPDSFLRIVVATPFVAPYHALGLPSLNSTTQATIGEVVLVLFGLAAYTTAILHPHTRGGEPDE